MAPNAQGAMAICPASLRPAKPLTMPWSGGRRGPSSAPVTLSFRSANHQPDDKAFVVPNLQVEASSSASQQQQPLYRRRTPLLRVALRNDRQSWPRKFGRSGRWSFCLMTGTLCPSNQERS